MEFAAKNVPRSAEGIRTHAVIKKLRPKEKNSFGLNGPSVEIRTRGLLNPIQARYQTSPHPDIYMLASALEYISTPFGKMQAFFSLF